MLLALVIFIYGKTRLHRIWALFNLAVSLWGFGALLVGKATIPSSAIISWRLAHIGVILIPVFFYHTICIFSDIEVKRRNFIIFAYLQGLFFLFLNLTDLFIAKVRFAFNSFYYVQAPGLFYLLFFFIWMSLVIWGSYELIVYYKRSSGIKKKNQSLYFLVGTLIGFSGGITNFFPLFGIDIYPFGNFVIPIYCLVITYAILRHRFMDIEVTISHLGIPAMFFVFVIGIPLGLVFMDPFTVSGLLLGVICLLLALVILAHRRTKLHHIWVLFNLVVSIWGFGCFIVGRASTESIALFGWRFAHIGGLFISVFFYHMVCSFCGLKRRKSITIAYSIGLFFLWFDVMTDQFINRTRYVFNLYFNDATWIYSIAVGLWLFLVVWSFAELLRFFPKTTGLKRLQTIYIISGFLIGFLGGITNFLPMFGINIYPFGNFTIPIYCLIVTYAILRYHLMDINIVVKKTAVYSLAAGILTSLFVVLVLTMTKYLSNMVGISSFTITVIAAVTIAILFNPLKNRIQLLIDKIFYKKTYDYYATIQKVSHDLVSMFDFKKIFNFVGYIIISTLGLKSIYLLSAVSGGDYEVVYHMAYRKGKDGMKRKEGREDEKELKINGNSEIIKLLRTSDDIVIKDELPGIINLLGQEAIDNITSALKPFNSEAIVPVFIDGKLSFLMILGEKLSGDMFTNEDINLLNTISNQTAIALKNASLYAEKVKSERLASMGMMSATFAHEIRNPLTSIKTFVQLMPEKHNDPEFQNTFSKIVSADIEKIDGLIKDLLHYSAGATLSRMDEVDITALMDEILEDLKVKLELERRKISVEKIYKNVKINITGDSKKLKQAFINIINNGCQAIQEDGVLRVSINQDGKNVDIAILDTGKGMPPEDIEKIFDPFYTTSEKGMGLGLAISKRIIEDHGGKIRVESKLSKGTTFTVTLPVN
ncbi:MAG: ATP-binding protein, partial [Nitrospirota bacterium]